MVLVNNFTSVYSAFHVMCKSNDFYPPNYFRDIYDILTKISEVLSFNTIHDKRTQLSPTPSSHKKRNWRNGG